MSNKYENNKARSANQNGNNKENGNQNIKPNTVRSNEQPDRSNTIMSGITTAKYDKWKTIAIVTLGVLLVVAVGGGIAMGSVASSYMREVESYYNKSYNQLVMDVNDLDSELSKLFVMNSDEARAIALVDVASISVSAEGSLENLPISKAGVSILTKYFNQMMDYSKFLTKKVTKGEKITEEEIATIKKLYDVNAQIKKSINDGYNDSLDGGGLYSKGILLNLNYIDPLDITYGTVSESSFEYPTMIYDGPFSDKKKQAEEEQIITNFSAEQAKEIAHKFAKSVKNLQLSSGDNEKTLAYSFSGEINGQNIYIQVAKDNGKVILFDLYKDVTEKKLSYEEGVRKAKEFLEDNGYRGVDVVWRDEINNVLMLNFAHVVSDVVIYSDLVKIKISLENGDVLGLEGLNYSDNNEKQRNYTGKITIEQAKAKVSKKLAIQTQRKAIIPINEQELLTYEFSGTYQGMTFYVYIDAQSGKEVNTLRVIRGTEGELVL